MHPALKKLLIVLIVWGVIAQFLSKFVWNDSDTLTSSSPNELLAPKQRKTFFDHLYENSVNEIQKEHKKHRIKKLNDKKESKMTKDFLATVSDFSTKFNTYRIALRESNPFYQLGFYSQSANLFNIDTAQPKYDQVSLGLINDPSYCEVSDFKNLYDPTAILTNISFFTDYEKTTKIRNWVLKSVGIDIMPEIGIDMNKTLAKEKIYLLNYSTSLFFTRDPLFHTYHEVGKHFLCTHQMYNHIPGNERITRIELLAETLENHKFKFGEQCVVKNIVYPILYKLEEKEDCEAFFKDLINASSNPNTYTSFIMRYKYQSYSKSKVFELDRTERESFKKQYEFGKKCGSKYTPILAQKIQNPKFLNATHISFIRTYMLVASTNPLVIYYHDGNFTILPIFEARSTAKMKYDNFEDLHESFPHYGYDRLEKLINKKARQNINITEDELMIQSQKWINETIRNPAKELMMEIAIENSKNLMKHSGVFELFALDFMLSTDKIYILDIKASPKYLFRTILQTKFFTKLITDMIEIQNAYLRSKISRIRKILPEIHNVIAQTRSINIKSFMDKFNKMNMNINIEKDYEINNDNAFEMIYHEAKPEKNSILYKKACYD